MSRRPPCPEALYGEHGAPNTNGNCPYCGLHLGRPRVQQKWEPDLDDWSDPAYVDRDPGDDPEGIVADLVTKHYGEAPRIARYFGIRARDL